MFDFLGNYKRVEELVTTIDVNKQNNVGDTALIRASETGKHVELSQKYIYLEAFNNIFFYLDNYEIVNCLIRNGANVELSNFNLQAPLHVAVSNGKK